MAKPITIKILGDATSFQKAVKEANTATDKLGAAVKVGSAVALGAVTAVGGGLLKLGSDFDKAYDAIAVGSGATGEALQGLKEDFKAVVRDIPTDFDTAANAIATLNTLTGATGDTLSTLTARVVDASRMLGEDGVANADAYGKALRQWGVSAEDGIPALDSLFKLTQDYGISLSGLTGTLSAYGAVLQNAGFEMEEAAVVFAQMSAGGISVSRVMPALNASFRNWAREGKNSREELLKVVQTIRDTEDSQKALALATEVFGAQGAQRLMTAIRQGIVTFDDFGEVLDGAAGSIVNTARETESFGEKWTRIKNRVFVALEPAAIRLFDAIGKAMDAIGPYVSKFVEWFDRQLPVAIEAIRPPVEQTFSWISQNVPPVLEVVIRHVQDNVLPVLQSLGNAFINHVLPAVQALWKSIKENVLPALSELWSAFQDNILPILQEVTGFIVSNVLPVLLRIGQWIAEKVLPVAGKLVGFILGDLIPAFFKVVGYIRQEVIPRIGAIGETIGSIAGKVIEFVGTVTRKFGEIVDFIRGMPGRIRSAARGMWDGITDAFKGAINTIIRGWNRLEFKIPGFKVGPIGYDGFTLGVPDIPLLANGAVVRRPTLALIGEAGPEAVVPLTRPNRAAEVMAEAGLSGRGGGVNITQHITAYDPRQAARESQREAMWASKTWGR